VIDGHSTAGVMIAASIIMGRALAPLESAIGGWNSLVAAREAYRRLAQELDREEPAVEPMRLPAPTGALVFESVAGGPPGARAAAVQGVHLVIEPGVCVGVTGPSGAGKSTLMRLAAGVWPAMQGCVRLDGADIAAWDRTDLGPHVGYLPQDIELFPGTVAENIARFGKVNAAAVVEAARLAGAHQMILGLQSGYDTELGPGGANVSGGQRQRIGLARAFYGSPALIVLDEPTSNLDAEGENTVRQAIDALRQRRSTVLVVAHRPALLGGTDRLLVMTAGQVARFGPTSELMPQITRRVVAGPDAASSPAAPSAPMRHA
jgi:PrtD family type I secretion system ABC transporter